MTFYTVPPSHSILSVTAERLIAETYQDPLSIAGYHIYLPTRRSCHRFAEIITELKTSSFLPKITPITNLDQEAIAFSSIDIMQEVVQLPKVLPAARRRALLFSLVAKFNEKNNKFYNISQLVTSLETLLDELDNEHIPLEKLTELDAGFKTDHQLNSLAFLNVFSKAWPLILQEENAQSAQSHRRNLIQLLIKSWQELPPKNPIWIIGATGSLPEISDLMQAVGGLKNGSVFLPGYDPEISDPIAKNHPLYSQKTFIEERNINPTSVKVIPDSFTYADKNLYNCFHKAPSHKDTLANKITFLEADHHDEEAATIALYIKEFVQTSNKKIIIVSQNQPLKARIKSHLNAFNIFVDESTGLPILQTAIGTLVENSLKTVAAPTCSWIDLIALLKHPYCYIEKDRLEYLSTIRWLEMEVLRGAQLPSLWSDIPSFLFDRLEKFTCEQAAFCRNLFEQFFLLSEQLRSSLNQPILTKTLENHINFIAFLVAENIESQQLLKETLEELAKAFDGLKKSSSGDYYEILLSILSTLDIPPPSRSISPQVQIIGVLESRLIRSDLMIMTDMNEESWPKQSGDDPWLNKQMRKTIGLAEAAEKLGHASHDMMNILGSEKVLLTRSKSEKGKSTRPNIFWQLLTHYIKHANQEIQTAEPYLLTVRKHWLNTENKKHAPPSIHVPKENLPRTITISDCQHLLNAPYIFYLKNIARLKPLQILSFQTDAVNFGIMMHDLLNRIATDSINSSVTRDKSLLNFMLKKYMKNAIALPFWRKRAENILSFFHDHLKNSDQPNQIITEIPGSLTLEIHGLKIKIKGRSDRINIYPDALEIIDYKTGQVPTQKAVELHQAPQLSLEAALYYEGSYQKLLPGKDVKKVSYWKLSGKEKSVEITDIKLDPKHLSDSVINTLKQVISSYYIEDIPFRSSLSDDYPDYYTLTRFPSWNKGSS